MLGNHFVRFRSRSFQDSVGLASPVLHDGLAVGKQLVRSMHRLREHLPNLLDQVQHLGSIHYARCRQGHGLGILNKNVQLIESFLDVHSLLLRLYCGFFRRCWLRLAIGRRTRHIVAQNFSGKRSNTACGTKPDTSPPCRATSLIRLEDR